MVQPHNWSNASYTSLTPYRPTEPGHQMIQPPSPGLGHYFSFLGYLNISQKQPKGTIPTYLAPNDSIKQIGKDEWLSSRSKDCKHSASRLYPSFFLFLAKPLDNIPNANQKVYSIIWPLPHAWIILFDRAIKTPKSSNQNALFGYIS